MKFLKDVYKDYFTIGAALAPYHLETHGELVKAHYNSLTCENAMKHSSMNREQGIYTPEPAQIVVDYAKVHGMAMRGHTFVWHGQTADHIFEGGDRDMTLRRMREHIFKMAEYFGDHVKRWDVVNEGVSDSADDVDGLRKSRWYEVIGPDYMDHAFAFAREAFPDAVLFFNDYNTHVPEKCRRICDLVRDMRGRGIPVDGVGMQYHISVHVDFDDVRRSMENFAALGVELDVTELDVSLYRHRDQDLRYDAPPAALLEKQADAYGKLFAIFREYKDVIMNVTTWGIADDITWLDHFPVAGRKNWPLLFDEKHEPKEAFWRVAEF